jgi:hypothetical protein
MQEKIKTLPDCALTRMAFSEAAWTDAQVEEGELEVEGKRYDIARVARRGSEVIAWVVHDAAEDNLYAFFKTLIRRHGSDKKPAPVAVVKLFALASDLPPEFFLGDRFAVRLTGSARSFPGPAAGHHQISTPPPKS